MLSFFSLVKELKNMEGNLYLLIGNGLKNQFRYISDLKKVLKKILAQIPHNSAFLYFGDYPNKSKPDIGYAFELISTMRPDITIYMIQIKEAESWGVPKFIKNTYWHTDYTKKCKWGGLYKGVPCSNTKKWVSLNRYISIEKAFVLGGGDITIEEVNLLKKLKIDYQYFPIERRYLGDGVTKVKDDDSIETKVGNSYKVFCKN
jgi:hypothetical protein